MTYTQHKPVFSRDALLNYITGSSEEGFIWQTRRRMRWNRQTTLELKVKATLQAVGTGPLPSGEAPPGHVSVTLDRAMGKEQVVQDFPQPAYWLQ